jgi:hypothetical protein
VQPLTTKQKTRIKYILAAGLFYLAYVLHPITLEGAAIAIQDSAGSAVGYLAGHRDVARGKIEIEVSGLRTARSDKLLESRYGIKTRSLGCAVSYYKMGYERSYWKVVAEAMHKKYGRDVFAECWRDSDRRR